MNTRMTLLLAALLPMLPMTASAKADDAAYCEALIYKYNTYVAIRSGRSVAGTVDGNVAVEQCKAGNTAAGIPVLEQKLRDAKVDLPSRD